MGEKSAFRNLTRTRRNLSFTRYGWCTMRHAVCGKNHTYHIRMSMIPFIHFLPRCRMRYALRQNESLHVAIIELRILLSSSGRGSDSCEYEYGLGNPWNDITLYLAGLFHARFMEPGYQSVLDPLWLWPEYYFSIIYNVGEKSLFVLMQTTGQQFFFMFSTALG